VSESAPRKAAAATVLSLAQLLEQQPSTIPACLIEPGLLPPHWLRRNRLSSWLGYQSCLGGTRRNAQSGEEDRMIWRAAS
jgi:hypothetical protein